MPLLHALLIKKPGAQMHGLFHGDGTGVGLPAFVGQGVVERVLQRAAGAVRRQHQGERLAESVFVADEFALRPNGDGMNEFFEQGIRVGEP